MDGEEESWSIAHKTFNKLQDKLDNFDNSVGLPAHTRNNKVCDYINIRHNDLLKLTPEQCSEIALDLASYAIYIQRELSREISYLNWVESKIDLKQGCFHPLTDLGGTDIHRVAFCSAGSPSATFSGSSPD